MSNASYNDRAQPAMPRPWQQERTALPTTNTNPLPILIFLAVFAGSVAIAYSLHGLSVQAESGWIVAVASVVAVVLSSSIKVADQWDRAVVLRSEEHTSELQS